jgi:MATE family multidrug resistance protein
MPTSDCLTGWGEYFAVSVPATIMICAEWWSFELFVVASSYMGTDYLAAMVILQNVMTTMFMVPLGLQEGVCSLVGSRIGANDVAGAKQTAYLTTLVSLGLCVVASVGLYFGRTSIATMFSADPTVETILVATLPILSISFVPDAI